MALKYKERIDDHLTQAMEQIEKLVTWIQYDRITKEEHSKYCENILGKLRHCTDLIDLE